MWGRQAMSLGGAVRHTVSSQEAQKQVNTGAQLTLSVRAYVRAGWGTLARAGVRRGQRLRMPSSVACLLYFLR